MKNMAEGDAVTPALQGFLTDWHPARKAPESLRTALEGSRAPARILCLGKAATGLARAAASLWPGVPGLLYGTSPDGSEPPGFLCVFGDHPFPTRENVQKTEMVEDWVAGGEGPLLACISGGGSALLVHPREPWTLEMKAELSRELWRRGARIRDVNTIRSRLSEVKGGGLRRLAGEWPVTTALWSDVSWNDRLLVSSGPTIPWSPVASAEQITERYSIELPAPLPPERRFARRSTDRAVVLCDALMLRRAAVRWLGQVGVEATEVPCGEGTPAKVLAARLARLSSGISTRTHAFVGTGEVCVEALPGSGEGGRCSHLAAEVALAMQGRAGNAHWAFVALATDGVDGSAGGGAWVDDRNAPPRKELERAIASFDTGALWSGTGSLVPRQPTGNNLRDLWVLVVTP